MIGRAGAAVKVKDGMRAVEGSDVEDVDGVIEELTWVIIERGWMVVSGWGDAVVVMVVEVKVKPEDETTVSSSIDSSASEAVLLLLAPTGFCRALAPAGSVVTPIAVSGGPVRAGKAEEGPVRAGKAEGGLREICGADRGGGGGVLMRAGDGAGKRAKGVAGLQVCAFMQLLCRLP